MPQSNALLEDVENLVFAPTDLGRSYAPDTVEIYTITTLPHPELIKDALEAYSRYSGALFYLFSAEEIKDLYKKTYWTAGGPSRATLCALCALASLGYHHDVEYVDLQIVQTFYKTAEAHLHFCLEEDRVYGMRVMVLLAANCIMEKKHVARTWIKQAMSIAKDEGFATTTWIEGENAHSIRLACQKNWLTMFFFDTWLAATVRPYPQELPYSIHDIVVLAARIKSIAVTRVDRIRSEMNGIGIILSGILQDAPPRGEVSLQMIRLQTAKTEEWVLGLPAFMKFSSLLAEDPGSTRVQRRTTFLVHLFFQGARMQLHRPTMLYLAKLQRDSPWVLDGTREAATESAEICVRSALQTAQIIFVLMSDNSVFKRCWIVIHQGFVAAIILVFNAEQKKKHGAPKESYKDESEKIEFCLRALEFCGTVDVMAKGYHARLSSYYDALRRPYAEEIDGQLPSNAATSRAPNTSAPISGLPLHLIEIFDQPFFDAIHQATGDWQDWHPQWLSDGDEDMLPPDARLSDGH